MRILPTDPLRQQAQITQSDNRPEGRPVVMFPARRLCAICRIPFRPARVHHGLCPVCFNGARWVEAFRAQERLWREIAGGVSR